jgi:hypothetical protein
MTFTASVEDSSADTSSYTESHSYPFTVTATAKGAATGTFTRTIAIETTCESAPVNGFVADDFSTTIPNPTDDPVISYTFPTGSAEYINVPTSDQDFLPSTVNCYQEFALNNCDADCTAELSIDQTTGRVTLSNAKGNKNTYNFDVTVWTFDGTSNTRADAFNEYS